MSSGMRLKTEVDSLRSALKEAERIQFELDLRIYHLKTLYDVSRDIFSSVDTATILRNFLLMTMGSYGVLEGFVFLVHNDNHSLDRFISYGLKEKEIQSIKEQGHLLIQERPKLLHKGQSAAAITCRIDPSIEYLIIFRNDQDLIGLLGMGAKLTGEAYNEYDWELLVTLINNLSISLKNATSFDEINRLNKDLTDKNAQLEETLQQLRVALRKVEILESVKANLSKFVPNTVCSLIELSPNGVIPDNREQDISVLFLDIEGYTRICERLGQRDLQDVIERHFSVFMDAIYANNGDVNETAGDGLMVIFQNEQTSENAREAVRTAVTIRQESAHISALCKVLNEPLCINMGINSGIALVGASKFNSYTGSRWTYTARGAITNIAARLGGQATGGGILLTRATADRVRGYFDLGKLGRFQLKNVSEPVEIWQVR
jgi:class 3 adenylate cyclase